MRDEDYNLRLDALRNKIEVKTATAVKITEQQITIEAFN